MRRASLRSVQPTAPLRSLSSEGPCAWFMALLPLSCNSAALEQEADNFLLHWFSQSKKPALDPQHHVKPRVPTFFLREDVEVLRSLSLPLADLEANFKTAIRQN